MMSVVCSCIFYPKGENRVQDLVISALNLDTHLLILISLPAPMKKALNTKAIIQLCVSVSKGQLAISTVSPLAASYNIISNRFETLAFFSFHQMLISPFMRLHGKQQEVIWRLNE